MQHYLSMQDCKNTQSALECIALGCDDRPLGYNRIISQIHDSIECPGITLDKSLDRPNTCSQAEIYFQATLFPDTFVIDENQNSFPFGQGVIIVVKDIPVGYLKLAGERTMLASQNIRAQQGFSLVRGAIYNVGVSGITEKDCWQAAFFDELSVYPSRMFCFNYHRLFDYQQLAEEHDIMNRIDELSKKIKN